MLLQQVPEIHDCRVFGGRSADRQASKLAHRSDLVQRFFHGWIDQREPVLQQVNAHHCLERVRLSTTTGLWVMRLNQRHQTVPRYNLLYFGLEGITAGLLALIRPACADLIGAPTGAAQSTLSLTGRTLRSWLNGRRNGGKVDFARR